MRLPIIFVQNAPASGAALADQLVGNLIGRPGLDLTLVNQFETLAPDSTDRMTLEGITVPSAVLDWRPPEASLRALEGIGFTGVRWPHKLDPIDRPELQAGARRLFLFDLSAEATADSIIAELNRLRESLSVKTVSLGSLGPSPRKTDSASQTKPRDVSSNTAPAPAVFSPADRDPQKDDPPKAESSPVIRASTSDEGLDDLLDRLDELDV